MDTNLRSAYDACLELLDDAVHLLSLSLKSLRTSTPSNKHTFADVMTWLSAASTDHDTCTEGFQDLEDGYVKGRIEELLKDLPRLVANSLDLFSLSSKSSEKQSGGYFNGNLNDNGRSRNGTGSIKTREWRFLNMSLASLVPHIVVSKLGTGTFRTITEAINAVPDRSSMRTVIYIKAGKYEEQNLEVRSEKTNVVMIGDGIGKTVITGRKNTKDDHVSTFYTASFVATGAGFMATNITFENRAGPYKDQAVALRVSSHRAVFYRCSFLGYQDTLYVLRDVQFFRECEIYGTTDFIFGDSSVVIQKSNIYTRTPLVGHPTIITAQNRAGSNDNTGIIIHDSRILPAPEFKQSKKILQTYLGRPWANFSRVVYMSCWMDAHINPQGWIPWSTILNDIVPDTLFYGEFNNSGPGASVVPRVNWTGYHRITSLEEVQRFTVTQFILGSAWLPSTGVPFTPGLTD
ncbi:probable pectinesterase/pectinesterase inhibitor 34 [Papaver somniferum]|uniref:probable pectinesterase/pectinesterase inhibitor 34 n=1 Tax=Papaver somniferum TaxID=3469 RepID=UPI000E705D9D|nr:probable pectinesterase/pectinesterase inhibitor 34 [Papaver somniferum]